MEARSPLLTVRDADRFFNTGFPAFNNTGFYQCGLLDSLRASVSGEYNQRTADVRVHVFHRSPPSPHQELPPQQRSNQQRLCDNLVAESSFRSPHFRIASLSLPLRYYLLVPPQADVNPLMGIKLPSRSSQEYKAAMFLYTLEKNGRAV